ncbi:MAG: phosphatase PAP2/dual specificity phosphatase family protein [Phycisphaerae bacterium]|nr:phosphatase PAP2/dual specificity phosphatase family protein [Phycisphaerae bacterium]
MGDLHGVGRAPGGTMKWKALRASILLSILFLVVYGSTNYFAAARSGVESCYCWWEKFIPFVPWLIVPYMSIDLFFVAAPFLCRTDRERRVFVNRIVFAILAAGTVFLLLPLRFAFERPVMDGWLGVVFNSFRELDKPFNQCPSLHITLCVLLATVYLRRTRGVIRVAIAGWFGLILLSPVLTYQHHVVDVLGGFVLAVLCIYLFPERPRKLAVVPNRRIGWKYFGGAVLFAAGCFALRPWSWVLLWPTVAFLLMGAAYFRAGPGVYRKRRGRLPITTRAVLWPVLLGQWVSWKYYARQCRAWDEATPRVWIGRVLTNHEARQAIDAGVTAVLDLTGEFSEAGPFRAGVYRQLPVLDLTAPPRETIDSAVEFIRRHARSGIVYAHCKIGYSRSAAAVGSYVISCGDAANADEAIEMLRKCRPSIVIRQEAMETIRDFERRHVRELPRHACVEVPSPTAMPR